MRKLLLLLTIIFATTTYLYAHNTQNNELMSSVNNEHKKTVDSAPKITSKEDSDLEMPKKKSFFGIGIGCASEGYVPINFHLIYKKVYYGFSASMPISKGTEDELYETVNWDELSRDHIEEGIYYTPITFDLGYDFHSFTIGIGAGIAIGTKYRNCFDRFHILGDNGAYYKVVNGGTSAEFKVFAKYRFKSTIGIHCYLGAQYTIKTGFGATIGIEF